MLNRTFMLSLAFVTGCAGITANSQLAPGTNVSQYRTFGWYPSAEQSARPISVAEQQVRASLARDLAQKGIHEAAAGQAPEFLIAYHGSKQQQLEVTGGYGYGWYGFGGFPDVSTYTQGTLVIDFIDPKTHTAFWRGTASAVMDHPDNPDLNKIDESVAKLMEQYPAMMATTPRQAM